MAAGLVAFLKGVAKTATTVDDQTNALPVTPLAGTPFAVEAEAVATAADPAYAEGAVAPLSMDRTGYLRSLAKALAKATAAVPAYIEASFNPFSMDLSGRLRALATIDQTTPGTTNNTTLDAVLDGAVTSGGPIAAASTVLAVAAAGFSGGMFLVTDSGGANTILVEASADSTNGVNGTWQSMFLTGVNGNLTGGGATAYSLAGRTTYLGTYSNPAAWVRIRVSTYAAGNVSATLVQKRSALFPPPNNYIFSNNGVGGGSGALLVAALTLGYNNGGGSDPMLSVGGALNNTNSGAQKRFATGECGRPYNHISTNATTTVKSGRGFLRSILIGTPGVANTATIYDNTAGSGTVIAILNTAVANAVNFGPIDLAFGAGLTIVTAGGTPPDMTVIYD